jgi:hypothetical protein
MTRKMREIRFIATKCPTCGIEVKQSSVTKALYEMDFLGSDSRTHRCNRPRPTQRGRGK